MRSFPDAHSVVFAAQAPGDPGCEAERRLPILTAMRNHAQIDVLPWLRNLLMITQTLGTA